MRCQWVIKEESLLWLGSLFQFGNQSFVLYCCVFSPAEPSPAPPGPPLADSRRDLSSHWLQGTPGRIQEPFFCLHAGREKPTNNRYLGQPNDHKVSHTEVRNAETTVHAPTHMNSEITSRLLCNRVDFRVKIYSQCV